MTTDQLSRLEGVMLEAYQAELGARINDPERLKDVYSSNLLKAEFKAQLQAIVTTTVKALRAEMAAINIVDGERQINAVWAGMEIDMDGLREEKSYCQHVIGTQRPFLVTDSRDHNLVCSLNAHERGIVSYLGVPLVTRRGNVIGSLCVTTTHPREWNAGDVTLLVQLAAAVMRLDGAS